MPASTVDGEANALPLGATTPPQPSRSSPSRSSQILKQLLTSSTKKREKKETSNGNGSIKPVNRIANVAKTNGNGDGWHCSDKQRGLILKLIADHNLEEVAEQMSREMFGCSPESLNKLQASGLIQRILEEHTSKKPSKGKYVNGGVR